MFSPTDTIVAIATAPVRAGIGVVRISGPRAHAVARDPHRRARSRAAARHADARRAALSHVRTPIEPSPRVGRVRSQSARAGIDEVVATYFPAPHSYTAEDVVEISAHGSLALLRDIVRAAIGAGARLAEPGEFTLRAFLNGRLDLVQAEAVADLVDAVTPLQARVAFDQLEGTLTRAIGALDARAVRPGGAARGVGGFPGRGLSLRRGQAKPARRLRGVRDGIDATAGHERAPGA